MGRLVVVSNRIPVATARVGATGGLAVALADVLARQDALWIGWNGDVAEDPDPPSSRRMRRTEIVGFGLTPQMHAGFYAGFSNAVLWPLFHYRLGLVEYRREDYAVYNEVNERFARIVRERLAPDDTLWVHDYHLIPLARILRRQGVTNRIGFFLHIPWPAAEVFRSLPVHRDLAEALAHYDLVGFQTASHAHQFADYLGSGEGPSVEAFGRRFEIGGFPIGIDTQQFAEMASKSASGEAGARLAESTGNRALVIGVDRLDHSKGLPNRIAGFANFLARNPDWHGRVQYLQIAPVSRGEVANYRALRRELDGMAGRLNGKYAEFDWTPLRYINRGYPRKALAAFYRQARIGLVTPLRDGMNLVAKEYVAAQQASDPGVLVLSEFAGAAAELSGALKVNPYDADAIGDAIAQGLAMPFEERIARWKADYATVEANTAGVWARGYLATLEAARGLIAA
ncbi:MAG: trehalose-6-phosphate synthase [Alphaproteobacteria bacterium]|nr:trehalose-6-phosphate synthase [Alphaproteobacteria bacterium]